MILLSLDPSTVATGYAIIDTERFKETPKAGLLSYGVIKTKTKKRLSDRIRQIYDELQSVIANDNPEIIVTEDQFGGRVNAIKALSQVRGAIMVLASKYDLPLYLLAPTQIKKETTGNGHASKEMVINSVCKIFDLRPDNLTSDMADAIAAGYTYLHFDTEELRTA